VRLIADLCANEPQKVAGRGRGGAGGALRVVRCMAASDAAQLKSAREDIKEILKTTYCHPILVRIFTLQISSTT
jgi:L-ascorbate peroxidase